MRPVSLDELPSYTPWPARLLGLEEFEPRVRGPEVVYGEYEHDLYGPLLDAVTRDPAVTLGDVRRASLRDPGRLIVMSIGPSLFALPADRAAARSEEIHVRYIRTAAQRGKTLLDLGCGYGHLLASVKREPVARQLALRGGDVSPSAVALARRFGFDADEFSFLDDACVPLEKAEPPVVVAMAFALHQLESSAPAVELLGRYREKIAAVVCLEPEESHFGDGLLGLMRRRYGQLKGYSADLLRVLTERDDVHVEFEIPAAVGTNALLPGTICCWKFR